MLSNKIQENNWVDGETNAEDGETNAEWALWSYMLSWVTAHKPPVCMHGIEVPVMVKGVVIKDY